MLSVLFIFKPLDIKTQETGDTPLFKINSFTIHEFNPSGLETFMTGSSALKFFDGYIVNEIDYTDNSKKDLANVKANIGTYKNNFLEFIGDVMYVREDGFTFESQKVTYNKEDSLVKSNGEYIAYREHDTIKGTNLKYNSSNNNITSKNILIKYQLEDN